MQVSVVIPAYNAAKTIASCVEACRGQSHPALEILVIDDGSTDDTAARASGAGTQVITQPNAGPAAARNRGAEAAQGEIVAYTDSDCVPSATWLAELCAGFSAPEVVAVGGTYDIANPQSTLSRVVHAEIVARHARFGEHVDFLGSFNVAYRREAFFDVGGFDTAFKYASGEDNDLAYRLQDAGGLLVFRKDAVVAHHHPVRLVPYLRTQSRHGYWRMKLYAKHRGRARTGDRYAGILELLGIPWSLIFVALAPVVGLAVYFQAFHIAGAYALLWIPLLAGYTLRAVNLTGTSFTEKLFYMDMAFLRDLARGWGMLKGAWHFVVRGKS